MTDYECNKMIYGESVPSPVDNLKQCNNCNFADDCNLKRTMRHTYCQFKEKITVKKEDNKISFDDNAEYNL